MFEKILIANRGEIACRIIETARKLGIATVAVYSDADAQARHVALADEAVHIGGPAPRDSYLRGEAIIAAARATGAQAIHPGYGFLSENPDFVDAVAAANLVFIGPCARAIRAMGLKDAAKKLMVEAGVPVVPGYHGADQDPGLLAQEAGNIGYPVLIKAVAGGGGKGMRKVTRAQDFAAALDSARGEARTSFGNDAVLIEKYVEKPRHIEVQIFGDGHDAIHLFERDCSLQRRHQKVIEEAPAPGMPADMRAAMGAAAVKAARAIGYSGAGTIEFIVDASDGLRPDRFWFMEMNTRLQVEHPVTEAITGVDLVEWQLRVASGEPLPARQQDLTITGHAFEARLYAEDVPAGFLPATGRLDHLVFPAAARSDSGVRPGDSISPWYDPMIAKIITHGPTRAIALSKLAQALAQTEVAGSVTNLAFLGALARHRGFAAGDVDTGLIERDLDALVAAPAATADIIATAVLTAADLPQGGGTGFALWAPLHRTVTLLHGQTEISARINVTGPDSATVILTKAAPADERPADERPTGELPSGESLRATRHDGVWYIAGARPLRAIRANGTISIFAPTGTFNFLPVDALARKAATGAAGNATLSPMPGLVKAVFVAAGQSVVAGDRLAVLEAMKMEHTLTAARDGIIAEVLVQPGAQVEAGAALVLLEPEA